MVSIRKGAAARDVRQLSRPMVPDLEGPPESSVPSEPKRPLLNQPWKIKAVQFGMIGAVVLGAISGPIALVASVQPAKAGQADANAPRPSIGPEGFAQLYLRTFMNLGDESHAEALETFYPDAKGAIDGMKAGHFYVAETATLQATQVTPGYWSILVAADLLESTEGGSQALGTSYYLISVYERDGRYIATSLPTQVPAPRTTGMPKLRLDKLNPVDPNDQLGAAVQRFFEAFLTGQGELSRYINPESGLRVMTPAPYATVQLRRMSRPKSLTGPVRVIAEVSAVNANGNTVVLQYNLELAQNDSNNWEVRGLLRSPELAKSDG